MLGQLERIDLVDSHITLAPMQVVNEKVRKGIQFIEAKIKSMPGALGEDPFPLKHSLAEGLYIREIFMPKGMLIVGKLHRDSYFNAIISGDVSVLTEDGPRRVTGACHMVSPPGTKRFGYTHEDTVWVTVHANPNNLTDIKALEELIHIKDYADVRGIVIDVDKDEDILKLFFDEVVFDIEKFRALTKEIYAHEKPGFWSDWTEEQQKLYMSGDWEAFSRSRGYTEEEIETLRAWIVMKERGEELGLNPLETIFDLSYEVVQKNTQADKNNEILKSSHIPTSKKIPYK